MSMIIQHSLRQEDDLLTKTASHEHLYTIREEKKIAYWGETASDGGGCIPIYLYTKRKRRRLLTRRGGIASDGYIHIL